MPTFTFKMGRAAEQIEAALGLAPGSITLEHAGTTLNITTPALTQAQQDKLSYIMKGYYGKDSTEAHEINPVASQPPAGNYRVYNLYVDTAGKLVVEYEDTPE